MANFDPNQWYHIYTKGNNNSAFMGGSLHVNNSYGTTFYQPAKIKEPHQQWQIYPIDSDYYVLRTQASGPDGFLSTQIDSNANVPSGITSRTTRGNLTDDSVYWQIKPWNDGFYYLTNKSNKTGLHLCDVSTQSVMEANLTKPDPPSGQSFYFEAISAIENKKYSTVNLPTATNSSPGTPTASSTSSSTPTSAETSTSSSSGLSTAAKAGIGAGVGGVALIALVVLGLFLFRRRKRQQQASAYQPANPEEQNYAERYAYKQDPYVDNAYVGVVKPELSAETDSKYEMAVEAKAPTELPAEVIPVEAAEGRHEAMERRHEAAGGPHETTEGRHAGTNAG